MNDIEEWAKEYSTKTGMKYEEIVNRALKIYRESIENGMSISDYKAGKELRSFLNSINKI